VDAAAVVPVGGTVVVDATLVVVPVVPPPVSITMMLLMIVMKKLLVVLLTTGVTGGVGGGTTEEIGGSSGIGGVVGSVTGGGVPHPTPSTAQGNWLTGGGPEPGQVAAAGAIVPATNPTASMAVKATRMGRILLATTRLKSRAEPADPHIERIFRTHTRGCVAAAAALRTATEQSCSRLQDRGKIAA
jgi:hypothetical protein